jgi:hypothetical protein
VILGAPPPPPQLAGRREEDLQALCLLAMLYLYLAVHRHANGTFHFLRDKRGVSEFGGHGGALLRNQKTFHSDFDTLSHDKKSKRRKARRKN